MAKDEIPENEIQFIEYKYNTSTSKFSQNKEGKLVFNCYNVNQSKDDTGKLKVKIAECRLCRHVFLGFEKWFRSLLLFCLCRRRL